MARGDDELPQIEVISGEADGGDVAVGDVASGPSRWPRAWLVGAIVIVVVLGAVAVVADEDRPSDEENDQSHSPPSADPSPASAPDSAAEPELSTPVSGKWQVLPTALTGPKEAPVVVSVDDDRVLLLYTENGGEDVAGEILDLRAGTSKAIAASPLNWRYSPMVGWTGSELVIVGGSNGPGIEVAGAAYDPSTDSWRQIADPPGFEPGASDSVVIGPGAWTGEELISWQSELAYNFGTDSWREIAPSPLAPRAHAAMTPTTSGGVLVWGGCPSTTIEMAQCHDDGATYDPTADEWRMIPKGPLGGGAGAVAVGTTWNDRVIVLSPRPDDRGAPTVAAFDASTSTWTELPDVPVAPGTWPTSLVWTGTHAVMWNGPNQTGRAGDGFMLNPAVHRSRYPAIDRWRAIPSDVQVQRAHSAVWTRHGLVVAGAGSRAVFTPANGTPCDGEHDRRPEINPDDLPELGATTYDNVAAAVLTNAQDIADTHGGVIDITVGPGLGTAYEDVDGELEIHEGLDDHAVTVHVISPLACGGGPAFVPGPGERRIPVRFVYEPS